MIPDALLDHAEARAWTSHVLFRPNGTVPPYYVLVRRPATAGAQAEDLAGTVLLPFTALTFPA